MPYDDRYMMDQWNTLAPVQQEQVPQVSEYQRRMNALPNAKYLGNDYSMSKWMADDEASGVTNPLIRSLRYSAFVEPFVEQARDDEIRESFYLASKPDIDPQIKTEALARLAYYMKQPDLVNNVNLGRMKTLKSMGLMENPNYHSGDSEYGGDDQNARQIYAHLKGKGLPDNVIAGIMGNLQQESGFNPNAMGDGGNSIGLAQWYQGRGNGLRNFAAQRGTDWNHMGTQLDYLLDEINRDYPTLLKEMGGMNPHDAAIYFHDVFERSADTPEMKAIRGQNASNIFNSRRMVQPQQQYIADPNYVSDREKFNMQMAMKQAELERRMYNQDRNYNLAVERLKAKQAGQNGVPKGFNKNNMQMRKSALELSGLQNIDADDDAAKDKYDKSMGRFSNYIANLCDTYDDGSMDSLTFALNMYNELNKTRSGLTPEALSEGVARAVYMHRGDVDAEELQRAILNYVYNGGDQGDISSQPTEMESEMQAPSADNVLNMADKRRGWNVFK